MESQSLQDEVQSLKDQELWAYTEQNYPGAIIPFCLITSKNGRRTEKMYWI
jgi:hypothetical protein